jgi:hypothetical protein
MTLRKEVSVRQPLRNPSAYWIAALSLAAWSCGGSADSPADPTPSPTPTPVAQSTPAPAPAPAPTPDDGLAGGPVSSVKAYIKTVESPERGSNQYRDPQKDADGTFVLYVGEYVVIDSTQRNADGQVCRWRHDPRYSWDNFDDMMDVRSSSEPFFFKFEVAQPGIAEVTSLIDGVESNAVKMRAVVRK